MWLIFARSFAPLSFPAVATKAVEAAASVARAVKARKRRLIFSPLFLGRMDRRRVSPLVRRDGRRDSPPFPLRNLTRELRFGVSWWAHCRFSLPPFVVML